MWVGEDEPADPDYNVWVDPNANPDEIPTKTSDLINDSGFISEEVDPVFTASPAHGIGTTDITNWDSKSVVSGTDDGTNWTSLTIDGTTKAIPVGGSGGGTWGSIIGTLSDQTDLQNELNDKVSSIVRETLGSKTYMASIANNNGYIEMSASYYGSDGGTYSILQMQPGTFNFHKYTSYTEKGSLEIDDNGTSITGIVTPTTSDMAANKDYVDTELGNKQDTLVSGTNIKTINNTSVLGSGNISLPQVVDTYSTSSTDAYSCSYLNGFTKYSTTETPIGKWIDDKPIYRKVFTGSSLSTLSTGITDADNVIKMQMLVRETDTNKTWRNIPWLYNTSDTNWMGGFYFRSSTGLIAFQMGNNLSNIDRYIIIIEYTKSS